MGTNYPNGLSSYGVPMLGSGPVFTTGNVFFVQSTNALADDSPGHGSKKRPFATIDYAVGKCTAGENDHIIVMPGHVETVTAAGGLDLDVAGISLWGIGNGTNRPQINFTTAVGADMDVDAANIKMVNFRFTGGVDALTGPIDINASDCELWNIVTQDVTGQATDFIVTDANADRLLINGWRHLGAAAAGADTAITMVGGDDISIQNFALYGNFAVAGIENVTTAGVRYDIGASSNRRNWIWTANAADVAVTMKSDTTGWIDNINCMLTDNAANITEALVGAAMQFGNELYVCNLAGERVVQSNITASTDA